MRGDGYSASGTAVSDAIRNITGQVGSIRLGIGWTPTGTGAFTAKKEANSGDANNGSSATMSFDFDASRQVPTADENRPVSGFGIWVIVAKGKTESLPSIGQYPTLTGGNTWNGSQAITGNLSVSGQLNADIKPLLNASGDAPIAACRAWLNMNGTGTSKLNGSMNIASLVDDGVGTYTIYFTKPMPHANYAVMGMGSTYSGGGNSSGMYLTEKTSSSSILTRTASSFSFSAINAQNSYSDPVSASIGVFC